MKLIKCFFLAVCLLGICCGYSLNRDLLKKHDYIAVIRNSIYKLDCNLKDHQASKTLILTYSQAIEYYQTEIDLILTSSDPFRWTKVLDVMQKTNELSDEILHSSAALRLICDPKIYKDEMKDVTSKAAAELYNQGVICLNQDAKEKAKEAHFYFIKASQLNPKYKDVDKKILEATSQASLKIIIEQVTVSSQNNMLGYSTQTFYQCLFYLLHQKFPSDGLIVFYSPEEAERQSIKNPDYSIQIEIEDFEIESRNINIVGKVSPRLYNGADNHFYAADPHPHPHPHPHAVPRGGYANNRISYSSYSSDHIISQLSMRGHSVLKINALDESNAVYIKKIPWTCHEELNDPDSYDIGQTDLLGDSNNQLYFDHFLLSMADKVVSLIANYFEPVN